MDSRHLRDSAFESVDVEENGSESTQNDIDDPSLDLLEQRQAKEQARLLQRFRQLRQWQQQQQEQLMQQQSLQLEMLKGEQVRVQSVIASQRGAQWGDGRVSRPEGFHKSPPLMTPPRRAGVGTELAKTMMSAFPQASTDSGLVASMGLGDTLEQPKDSLPMPVMYPTSPQPDDDKYTNPELFSNPGDGASDLGAFDDCQPLFDNRSEVGSDNFYLPPLPPDPKEPQGDLGSSLKTLQALMGNTATPNLLQQVLGLLPAQQRSLLLEQRQAAVQESASPTFSPPSVHPSSSLSSSSLHHSLPLTSRTVAPGNNNNNNFSAQSLQLQSSSSAAHHPGPPSLDFAAAQPSFSQSQVLPPDAHFRLQARGGGGGGGRSSHHPSNARFTAAPDPSSQGDFFLPPPSSQASERLQLGGGEAHSADFLTGSQNNARDHAHGARLAQSGQFESGGAGVGHRKVAQSAAARQNGPSQFHGRSALDDDVDAQRRQFLQEQQELQVLQQRLAQQQQRSALLQQRHSQPQELQQRHSQQELSSQRLAQQQQQQQRYSQQDLSSSERYSQQDLSSQQQQQRLTSHQHQSQSQSQSQQQQQPLGRRSLSERQSFQQQLQQSQGFLLSHSHSNSHSQASLNSHCGGTPCEVNVRASWEEREEGGGERGGGRGGGGERGGYSSSQNQNREEEEVGEEEEEDELEVTVKRAGGASPEERPIVKPGRTFQQLLEDQLAQELAQEEDEGERAQESHQSPSAPVKRPFLRKGQGIARFSQPIKKPPPRRRTTAGGGGQKNESSHSASVSRSSSATGVDAERTAVQAKPPTVKRQPDRKRGNVAKNKVDDEDPPQLEKLKLIKRRSESGKKTQAAAAAVSRTGEAVSSAAGEDHDDKDSIADDASFVAGWKEREKKAPMEAEELDEFEALEDIADNMSLVSNSSAVRRLITPNKQRQKDAVTDLKNILEKKKNGPSSPFERNAAFRSLLSGNALGQTSSQWQDSSNKMQRTSPDDPHADTDLHLQAEGQRLSGDGGRKETVETYRVPSALDLRNATEKELGAVKSSFSENGFRLEHQQQQQQQQQPLNGLHFSNQFSLFDQHRRLSDDDVREEGGEEEEEIVPSSPTKSVTRKVATLQSRLNAANDTAALLQRLTTHAGYLSSGVSRTEEGGGGGRVGVGEGEETSAKSILLLDENHDESGMENSLLSSSVSRPRPLVIGGKKDLNEDGERTGRKLSGDESESDDDDDTVEEEDDDEEEEEESSAEEKDAGARRGLFPDGVSGGGGQGSADLNTNNSNDREGDQGGFDDEDEWTSGAPVVSGAIQHAGGGGQGQSTPPTSKLMSRLFPKLKAKPSAAQQQQEQKLAAASAASVGDGIQSKVLRQKLAELEAEIEKFRNENATLDRLRRDREEGLNKLKEEISRFEQEKTDELRRLEEFKSQEAKKLKQERKLFETYQKQVRSMPDKKDREEIDTLKRQLGDLQDEMKRKESRWTATATRLKTRISEVEGENSAMKDELKLAERRRLEWMQTRGASKAPQPTSQQPTSTAKTAPRSSTPTNDSTTTTNNNNNNIHITTTTNNNNPARFRATPNLSGAVAMPAQTNGVGAAGKVGSGVGGASGESMPRGQPATPSMIEGVSPAALGEGGEGGSSSFLAERSAPRPKPALDRPTVDKGNGAFEETQHSDGKVERVYNNGSREVLFANGTGKEISCDGQYFIVSFFNGDIKQVFPDQRVVYYYAESQTTHTTYPDRLEVLQFPNNQIEKHYPDGTHEITFPNQTVKYLFPNGSEESIFADGTILRIDKNGEKILEFPNGQREIHTQQHKRREYPDGTVKTLHNDGRQETRYSTGRVRLKDKDGNVIMDRMY